MMILESLNLLLRPKLKGKTNEQTKGAHMQFSGGKLRLLRETKGMSTTRLAELCGVDKSTMSRWESGLRAPRGWRMKRLCEVLECRREDFSKTKRGK